LVERSVRILKEIRTCRPILRTQGDPDAGSYRDLLLFNAKGLGQGADDPAGESPGRRRVDRARSGDDEFIAADPRHHVSGANQ
jgi:hypothetical protein